MLQIQRDGGHFLYVRMLAFTGGCSINQGGHHSQIPLIKYIIGLSNMHIRSNINSCKILIPLNYVKCLKCSYVEKKLEEISEI